MKKMICSILLVMLTGTCVVHAQTTVVVAKPVPRLVVRAIRPLPKSLVMVRPVVIRRNILVRPAVKRVVIRH